MDQNDRLGALLSEDGRYRLLIEAVTDYAIFMLDPTGIVMSWNPGAQRFKGYAASEIIGQHFSRFYSEEDRKRGIPALAHTKLSHLLHSLSFPELTDVPQALRTFESTLELTAGTVLKLYIPLRIDKEESGLSPLKRQTILSTEIRCQCEPAELSSSSGYNVLSYVWRCSYHSTDYSKWIPYSSYHESMACFGQIAGQTRNITPLD